MILIYGYAASISSSRGSATLGGTPHMQSIRAGKNISGEVMQYSMQISQQGKVIYRSYTTESKWTVISQVNVAKW